MHASKMIPRTRKVLSSLSISLTAVIVFSGTSFAQMSEIDAYDRAVSSQSKDAALAFLDEFRSSHLVGDLIESLRPDVAREVCASLRGGGPHATRRACTQLPQAAAAEPAERPPSGETGTPNVEALGPPTGGISETMADEAMMSSGIGEVAIPPGTTPSTLPAARQPVCQAQRQRRTSVRRKRPLPFLRKPQLHRVFAFNCYQQSRPRIRRKAGGSCRRLTLICSRVSSLRSSRWISVQQRACAGPIADRDEANIWSLIIGG